MKLSRIVAAALALVLAAEPGLRAAELAVRAAEAAMVPAPHLELPLEAAAPPQNDPLAAQPELIAPDGAVAAFTAVAPGEAASPVPAAQSDDAAEPPAEVRSADAGAPFDGASEKRPQEYGAAFLAGARDEPVRRASQRLGPHRLPQATHRVKIKVRGITFPGECWRITLLAKTVSPRQANRSLTPTSDSPNIDDI